VTTTDELIPSGEASSYRSNPLALAEFTLSRKDPAYVGRAKAIQALEKARQASLSGGVAAGQELDRLLALVRKTPGFAQADWRDMAVSSAIYARKPGDGSAREQAASCQRVLGAGANIAAEYATKRYRSNLINWGILPFLYEGPPPFGLGDVLFFPDVREALAQDAAAITGWLLGEKPQKLVFAISPLTGDEAAILRAGSLINFNRTA
jgi:aconitate hydratase